MTAKSIDMKAAVAAAGQLKGVMESLRAKRSELCEQQAQLQDDSAALYRQPLRVADIKGLVLLAIDRWGQEFLASWGPVLRDFAIPRGRRPKQLEEQEDAYAKANAKVKAAMEQVERVKQQLETQTRQDNEAAVAAESGKPYARPKIDRISPDELTRAKAELYRADSDRRKIEKPGTVNFSTSTFVTSTAPITVMDVEVVLQGEHTSILASSDAPYIDPYRNIFSGVLDPNLSLDARANQERAVKGACFFLGDLIKAKVEKHFDSVVHADEQAEAALLSLDECRARIAANEEQVAKIQGEIDQIDSQLSQLTAKVTD